MIGLLLVCVTMVSGGPATEDNNYKDQYCTDPRTMRRHNAYTEWADAYSCTRHRCQPGGRNLAIYTVGCKRVEAPESAIECEEVVEDTNMQFPFCCTRLRCLVVVRGEVWTRVLGQPWETLPAAPWSHMYKMKKPPPGSESAFLPKAPDQGPIYELAEAENTGTREKVLRASKKAPTTENSKPRVKAAAPDFVIALSTNTDTKELNIKTSDNLIRHKRIHNQVPRANYFEEDRDDDKGRDRNLETDGDLDDAYVTSEKPQELSSDERYFAQVTQKSDVKMTWTEIPQNQWNEHDPGMETESNRDNPYNQQDFPIEHQSKAEEKPSNLQALVDAIGSRMKDIENVVQRMSEKVQQPGEDGGDKGAYRDEDPGAKRSNDTDEYGNTKRPNTDEHYKRFSVRNRGSKYLHAEDSTTEQPLFVEDNNLNGYFSDASNSVLRRSNSPKEPAQPQTYMAPVETRRKGPHSDTSEEKKRKKHRGKKKKGKHHKKHHNKKRFNRLTSVEVDKNIVSLEDSSAVSPA